MGIFKLEIQQHLNNSQKYGKIYLNAYNFKKESVGFIRRQLDNEIAGQSPARDESRPKSKSTKIWGLTMEAHYVIEKFTRCPGCRSFSLKGLNPDETGGIPGVSPGNVFVCNNCGAQFTLRGNTLKEISSLLHQNKQKTQKREPVRIESRTITRTAISLIFILCLIIGGIFLLLHSGNQDQGQIEALEQKVNENTTSFKSRPGVKQKEAKKTNLVKAVIKETEEANEETRPIEPVMASQLQDEPETGSGEMEPISYKIVDVSGMKIRSSSPHRSDRSLRWNFKRKAFTIKRSKTQRVYIAGDPTGKAKWAVDDEIIVNGEKIKGFSEEMTQIGYIPESKCRPPCDITHLVSADRKTVLDIKLVDYGVFWGNTSLYLVIM